MNEQLQNIEVTAKRSWGVIMAWIGGITAVIGFIGTIGGGLDWFRNHHRQSSEYTTRMELAQTETKQRQYRAALGTYGEILKEDPLDRPALDSQLDTAMLWIENFSVMVPAGRDEGDISGPALDDIFPVLNAGLTRVRGARSADVQAHLGWAHFLNEKIAIARTIRSRSKIGVKRSKSIQTMFMRMQCMGTGSCNREGTSVRRSGIFKKPQRPIVHCLSFEASNSEAFFTLKCRVPEPKW